MEFRETEATAADSSPQPSTLNDTQTPATHSPPGSGEGASDALAAENRYTSAGNGPLSRLECLLVRSTLRRVGNPPVAVVLSNGGEISPVATTPVARLRIQNRRTLWKLITDPLVQFGEAYTSGSLKVEGNLVETLTSLERSLRPPGPANLLNRGSLHRLAGRRSGPAASRRNIHRHYDIGNDFYRLWLDERMIYTCAYFADPSFTLEQAQVAKLDHVCRKLRLRPGDTVIEAGCGWGALALHMAREYGVHVRAFNISHQQIAYARQRARTEGLADRVEFIEDDWRNITGQCDAFVSVGMLEHVGPENYRRLGDVIHACLKPDGRGLLHFIGRNRPHPLDPWIERRIFPAGYVPSLREMLVVLEPHDFSVLDVENLRLHYAETLRHWLDRYERSVATVREMFDEQFVRAWRLYLSGSIAAFEIGRMQLFQIVFQRGGNNNVPRTRAYLEPGREAELLK